MAHEINADGSIDFNSASAAVAFVAGIAYAHDQAKAHGARFYNGAQIIHGSTYATIFTGYGTASAIEWATLEYIPERGVFLLEFIP